MRLFISESRTILNTDEVDTWIEGFKTKDPAINTWLDTVVLSYLLKEYDVVFKVVPPTKVLSPIQLKALEHKDLYLIKLDDHILKCDLAKAITWLESRRDPKIRIKASMSDALRKGRELYTLTHTKVGDTKVLFSFNDGMSIVELLDAEAIQYEAGHMKNSIRNNVDRYAGRVSRGEIKLWSLRDAKNIPHLTCTYTAAKKAITEIKCVQNKGIKAKYQKYASHWFQMAHSRGYVTDIGPHLLMLAGILKQDGMWYNVFDLGDGFTVTGDCNLTDLKELDALPTNLTVTGSLYLTGTSVKEWPKGLHVANSIYISPVLESLPEGLVVKENLSLSNNPTIKIPKKLKVGSSLRLWNTSITGLLPDTEVGGVVYHSNPNFNTKVGKAEGFKYRPSDKKE